MRKPVLCDLRNIYDPDEVEAAGLTLRRRRARARRTRARAAGAAAGVEDAEGAMIEASGSSGSR